MPDPHVPSHCPFFETLEQGETYKWCACGRSDAQPFCDESHREHGMEPLEFTREGPTARASLCGCKHTKTPPYCDGSHRELMVAEDDSPDAMEARFPKGIAVVDEHTADCTIGKCMPDLPVRDAPAAIRYYAEVLGFTKQWDDAVIGFDHIMYACVARDEFRVTLDEHRAKEDAKVQLTCHVDDVDALHAELAARGAKIVQGLTDHVWQERSFTVEDLDGHRLSFSMPLSED